MRFLKEEREKALEIHQEFRLVLLCRDSKPRGSTLKEDPFQEIETLLLMDHLNHQKERLLQRKVGCESQAYLFYYT